MNVTMSKKEQILEYIQKNPGCTRREVAAGLSTGYVYASATIAKLVKGGEVSQERVPGRVGLGRQPLLLTITPTATQES